MAKEMQEKLLAENFENSNIFTRENRRFVKRIHVSQ